MTKLLLAVPLMLMAASANAASLDFTGLAGSRTSPLAVPTGATITHETPGGTILVGPGSAGQADGFCFLMFGSCEAGGTISFESPVTNLTFDIDGWQAGDTVDISAFLGANFLSAFTFNSGNQVVNQFAGLDLDRIVFVDNSTAAGVGYSTFRFDVVDTQTPPIPLPATALLLIGGVGTLAAFGRRKAAD